jgi:hypothetical protein
MFGKTLEHSLYLIVCIVSYKKLLATLLCRRVRGQGKEVLTLKINQTVTVIQENKQKVSTGSFQWIQWRKEVKTEG